MSCKPHIVTVLKILSVCTVTYVAGFLILTALDASPLQHSRQADHSREEKNEHQNGRIITLPSLHTTVKASLPSSHPSVRTSYPPPSIHKQQRLDTNSVPPYDAPLKNNVAVNGNCSDRRCTSLLSDVQKRIYSSCESSTFKKTQIKPQDIPYRCAFRDGRGLDPVALVSVPGSGNTWVRGLLEKATGICTGSIYCDTSLRAGGFVGENIRDGSVIAIKTHTSDYQWKGAKIEKRNKGDALYGSAIMIIRNPFDAFVADRHRLGVLAQKNPRMSKPTDMSHVGKVNKSEFCANKDWNGYVYRTGERWKKTLLKWLGSARQLGYPLLVVRYEDLKKDKVGQVSRMLDFLHQDYNKTELAAGLEDDFDKFHRPHTAADTYDHYTEDQRVYIKSMIKSALKELQCPDYKQLGLVEYL